MAGSITPLPIMQLEEEEDRKRYEALEAPKSIVVRYGYLKFIAELPYDGKDKPGCGSKMVVMTNRGVEMAEMLTTTCSNNGCGKSVSRKDMLAYIENSGGKDFPFTNQGKVVRVASHEDVKEQERLEAQKMPMIRFTKTLVMELGLPMKLVDIECLLGGERIIFHYTSESWVDFRELVKQLATEYQTRIEMHQVNARDEARLVADYEKCGQQCCCKQFLKVLKPVSMRSAKVQKATLDPTKISGRCGRLMCCLRYEDQTYEDLRKRLPHRQTRVMTVDGPGIVIDSQILTQLILVVLDNNDPPSAYPLENIEILTKEHPQFRKPEPEERQMREPRRDRTGPSNRGGGGGRGGDNRGGDNRGNDTRGGDNRSSDNRGGDNRGNDNRGGENRGADRGPQRPRPGQPLADNQVESREGQQSDQVSKGYGNNQTNDTNDTNEQQDQSQPQVQGDDRGNNRDGRDSRDNQDNSEGRSTRGSRGPRSRGPRSPHDNQGGRDGGGNSPDNADNNQNANGGDPLNNKLAGLSQGDQGDQGPQGDGQQGQAAGDGEPRKRRRRRRRGRGKGGGNPDNNAGGEGNGPQNNGPQNNGPQD